MTGNGCRVGSIQLVLEKNNKDLWLVQGANKYWLPLSAFIVKPKGTVKILTALGYTIPPRFIQEALQSLAALQVKVA